MIYFNLLFCSQPFIWSTTKKGSTAIYRITKMCVPSSLKFMIFIEKEEWEEECLLYKSSTVPVSILLYIRDYKSLNEYAIIIKM